MTMIGRIVQGRVAMIISKIDGNFRHHSQSRNNVFVSSTCCLHQRSSPTVALVGQLWIGAGAEQGRCALPESLCGCVDQSCVPTVIACIHQVPVAQILVVDELLHNLGIPIVRCEDQSSVAVLLHVAVDILRHLSCRQRCLLYGLAMVQNRRPPRHPATKHPGEPGEWREGQDVMKQVIYQVQRPHHIPPEKQPTKEPNPSDSQSDLLQKLFVHGHAPAALGLAVAASMALERLDYGSASRTCHGDGLAIAVATPFDVRWNYFRRCMPRSHGSRSARTSST
mmetsp:Transcript_66766/g.159340  ORF Transcript_66766/g.159340 Transcript_66766/m.159340 type:complete len:281 (-) Transcript_66766:30-872(-)